MNKMAFRKVIAILLVFVMGVVILPYDSSAKQKKLQIDQKNGIVQASNGHYTLTYNLSTGQGNVTWDDRKVLQNFNSNYKLAGNDTRFRSSDPAVRTAEWSKIGDEGYGRDGVKLTIRNKLNAGSTIVTHFYLYSDKSYFLTDMSVVSPSSQTVEIIEPISSSFLDIGSGTDKRIFTTPYSNNFDFGVAPVDDFGNSQNGADRFEGEQLKWEPFNGISHWVAAMFDNTSKQGFVAGAATVKNWKSSQRLGEAEQANGPLTSFSLYNWGGTQSGETVSSDLFFIGYYGDYQAGLEEYGSVYNIGEPRLEWDGEVPMGYNTYYSHYNYATAEAMYPLVDYMAEHLQPLGYEYFNLDGGFQPVSDLPFDEGMQAFADYVHEKGLKVGGYQTPFTIYDAWLDLPIPGTEYNHRDISLKDENGQLIRTYLGTYAMDITHPAAQVALRSAIQKYIDWGFDYLKLDFIDMGMYDGLRYDPAVNGVQAYRIGMGIIRDAVLAADRPIYINESIAPLLPAAFAHGRRSACDTTIGVDGYSGIERQAFNTAASWWTNGTLYEYNDADMIIPENFSQGFWYKYSQSEGKLLATTVALGGGHWLAGDNFPFLSEERMSILENKKLLELVRKGKAAKPVDMPNVYHKGEHSPSVVYITDNGGDVIVGLSNWNASEEKQITVNLSELGLNPHAKHTLTELYSGKVLGKVSGKFTHTLQPNGTAIIHVSKGGSGRDNGGTLLNLALGKQTGVSSTWSETGYEADKLTDGLSSTRWSAADGQLNNQWAEIDFAKETSVNRVVIKEHKGTYFQIANYALQYWDGTKYVDITKGFTVGDNKVINFETVSTSKIRIFMKTNYIIPSIEEIEAYYVEGNSGPIIDQDNSNSDYASYSDIRAKVQRMQVFKLNDSTLPKIDLYIYESYVNTVPADAYYFDIVMLDEQDNPQKTIFSASLPAYNIPGSVSPYSIYPKLENLDTSKKYGIILKSPKSVMTESTNNNYGFAYNDTNSYPDGYERISLDGGETWTTENNGERDLIFTIYSSGEGE
ncbi:discoidin domain-containing protein [Paenibacillus sp. LHD-38]|uniref:discoidin domain-containing protein n=1 Tax=Paenibacillus sp. LHD-38 TaxID=3072143 RepID=UPI00280FCF24|nr:discoidin domain-containing protein [Paenibacillus sp. LHD-38]MDQ8739149.1 discoidin domain-containing protein [Paenibacillus sp. LHD-38]